MRTTAQKLKNLLDKAQKDLLIKLSYVDCATTKEFFKKRKTIKSFHAADDVLGQIRYIKKLMRSFFKNEDL